MVLPTLLCTDSKTQIDQLCSVKSKWEVETQVKRHACEFIVCLALVGRNLRIGPRILDKRHSMKKQVPNAELFACPLKMGQLGILIASRTWLAYTKEHPTLLVRLLVCISMELTKNPRVHKQFRFQQSAVQISG